VSINKRKRNPLYSAKEQRLPVLIIALELELFSLLLDLETTDFGKGKKSSLPSSPLLLTHTKNRKIKIIFIVRQKKNRQHSGRMTPGLWKPSIFLQKSFH
jgi:hypothetical protein